MKIKKHLPVIVLSVVSLVLICDVIYKHYVIQKQIERIYDIYAVTCQSAMDNIIEYQNTGDEKYYAYLIGDITTLWYTPLMLDADSDESLRDSTLQIHLGECQSMLINHPDACRENLSILYDALAAFEEQGRYPSANHENRLSQFYYACSGNL